jgi:hypothetical protein
MQLVDDRVLLQPIYTSSIQGLQAAKLISIDL